MKRSVNFVIPGPVVPQGRPRVTRTGHAFTPAKSREYKQHVESVVSKVFSDRQQMRGSLYVEITVKKQPPQSWSIKKRVLAIYGDIKPTSKPDCDNLAKGVLDGCNGIAWHDDAQICMLVVTKKYSQVDEAEVHIEEMEEFKDE